MKYFTTIISALILLAGCVDRRVTDFQTALDTLLGQPTMSRYDYIVIIPQEGCDGCITFAEDFYNSYGNEPGMLFVFTNIISEKKLGKRVKLTESSVVDKGGVLIEAYKGNGLLYPCVVTLDKGKVKKVGYESPDEDSLMELELIIQSRQDENE